MAGDSPSAAKGALSSPLVGELTSARCGAQIWWLEDDRHLCRLVEARLQACGWRLTLFHKGQDLLDTLHQDQPDLLILDRLLPGINGMALLHSLRQNRHAFPVLMLSAMGSPDERIEGLALGANDYLAKPFRSRELIWRIERLLQGGPPPLIHGSSREGGVPLGPLVLDRRQRCLRDATGMECPLSHGDIALLLVLLEHPGTVRSREQLARASGSMVDVTQSRSLDVRLSRLRRQLQRLSAGGVSIEAVRGIGYRLKVPSFGSNQEALASILILGMGISLVGLQSLLAFPPGLLWAVGMGGLLITTLFQRRRILRLQAQLADQALQAVERRAHWQTLLHDLAAPLTRLVLRVEDLHPDQPVGQELLEGLSCDLHLLEQLQRQMRASRGEPSSFERGQTVELAGLCQRIARHYRRDSVQLAVPRLTLRLDVPQLQRVLHNLIDNALEHGSPPVHIRAYPVPGGLVLEIEDRGPALVTVASDLVGGWPHGGLGLALAMDFCGRHGGRLELEPQTGSGLLVRLRLGEDCVLSDPDSAGTKP